MNLLEIFTFIDTHFCNEDKEYFANTSDSLHHSFGRWIRNNCKLWEENGTDNLVNDLLKIKEYYVYSGSFTRKSISNVCDDSIYHPDNCSNIIIKLYKDYLNKKLDPSVFNVE